MNRTRWRNVFHKFIASIGFMALITISTGANNKNYTSDFSPIEDLFKQQSYLPAPLKINQCENKNGMDSLIMRPADIKEDACFDKKEGKYVYGK